MKFFVGLHQPSDAGKFRRCCVSVNRLLTRKKHLGKNVKVFLDSGAFTTILKNGGYPDPVKSYADQIRKIMKIAHLEAVVAQDYMCEPHMLEKTGLTIEDHQRLTIERYDELCACKIFVPIIPVLQGYDPKDYVAHIRLYRDRLEYGDWVGVGSICKRNSNPKAILAVLKAIKTERPDLRLHGFGVKLTALKDKKIRDLLYSADSMAWSYSARKQGRNSNSWKEAEQFVSKVEMLK